MLRIGILTHNAVDHTKRCIASLQAHTSVPWCAYLLDNASADETPVWLSELNDAHITVECRDDNLGVSAGRNHLLQQMLPLMQDDDLLVFLDNDIEVGAEWAQPFLNAFAERPRLGVAGRWAFSMIVMREWRDILAEVSASDAPADTVQGCCFWVRAAAARAVGAFDTSLGRFWHEDDDYCIRALHAGWDVRRVACSSIVHHEHGSGVALHSDRLAGSLANQRVLAAKWRAMGAIDDDGVPRRPHGSDYLDVREQLATRLGRPRTVLRTELQSAISEVSCLLPYAQLADATQLSASPAARALLEDMWSGAAPHLPPTVREAAAIVSSRVDRVLAERRDACGAPAPTLRQGAFSAICNPLAWDDSRWANSYESLLCDAKPRDFFARSETTWRDGQLLHALRVTNAISRSSRVLVVGHASERTIAALTHLAGHVTVMDSQRLTVDAVRAMSLRPLGDAAVEVGHWPTTGIATTRSAPFDVVLCPNSSRYAPAAEIRMLFRQLASQARTGATVALGVSLRITGTEDRRWLERGVLADDAFLCGVGLRRIGRFDDAIADATLLGAVPCELGKTIPAAHLRPQFARDYGAHLVTQATLVSTRTE